MGDPGSRRATQGRGFTGQGEEAVGRGGRFLEAAFRVEKSFRLMPRLEATFPALPLGIAVGRNCQELEDRTLRVLFEILPTEDFNGCLWGASHGALSLASDSTPIYVSGETVIPRNLRELQASGPSRTTVAAAL
jgi:hypothetical protein